MKSFVNNQLGRFIPAYAGNSVQVSEWRSAQAVHPRLRGELRRTYETRQRDSSAVAFSNRFIPAYAGNSTRYAVDFDFTTVHPRLRGELGKAAVFLKNSTRFIPAYAGNSLKQGIEHLTNSSKDFLSGKYAKNPETVLNHFMNSSLD